MPHPNMTLDLHKKNILNCADEAEKLAKTYLKRVNELAIAQRNGKITATHPATGKDTAIADVIAEYANRANTLTQNAGELRVIASKP